MDYFGRQILKLEDFSFDSKRFDKSEIFGFNEWHIEINLTDLLPEPKGKYIDIKDCEIFESEVIESNSVTKILIIHSCTMKTYPESMKFLKGLEKLKITNSSTTDQRSSSSSEKSEHLFILKIPHTAFKYLRNLSHLDLSNNGLQTLPRSISYLNKLRFFKASANHLTEYPLFLNDLFLLEVILLNDNKIKVADILIQPISKLKTLDISNNLLTKLNFEKFPEDLNLICHGNYFENVPDEIAGMGLNMINYYFFQKELKNPLALGPLLMLDQVKSEWKILREINPGLYEVFKSAEHYTLFGVKSAFKHINALLGRKNKVSESGPQQKANWPTKIMVIGNNFESNKIYAHKLSQETNTEISRKGIESQNTLIEGTVNLSDGNKQIHIPIYSIPNSPCYEHAHRFLYLNNTIYLLVVDLSTCQKETDFYTEIGKWYDRMLSWSPKSQFIILWDVSTTSKTAVKHAKEYLIKYVDKTQKLHSFLPKYICDHFVSYENNEKHINIFHSEDIYITDIPIALNYTLIGLHAIENKTSMQPMTENMIKFLDKIKFNPNRYFILNEEALLIAKQANISNFDNEIAILEKERFILCTYNKDGTLEAIFHQPLNLLKSLERLFGCKDSKTSFDFEPYKSTFVSWMTQKRKTESEISNYIEMLENGFLLLDVIKFLFWFLCSIEDHLNVILNLLEKIGFCLKLNQKNTNITVKLKNTEDVYIFPCLLKSFENCRDDILQEKFNFLNRENNVKYEIQFENISCSFDAFLDLTAQLYSTANKFLNFHCVWREGFIGNYDGAIVMVNIHEIGKNLMRITVQSKIDEKSKIRTVDQSLNVICNEFKTLLENTPGLVYDGVYLVCPVCGDNNEDVHPLKLKNAVKEVFFRKCNAKIEVDDLKTLLIEQNNEIFMYEVALHLRNEEFINDDWTVLADALEMRNEVLTIIQEVQYVKGKPNIKDCIYKLILLWGEKTNVKYHRIEAINVLVETLQSIQWNNIAMHLKEKFIMKEVEADEEK